MAVMHTEQQLPHNTTIRRRRDSHTRSTAGRFLQDAEQLTAMEEIAIEQRRQTFRFCIDLYQARTFFFCHVYSPVVVPATMPHRWFSEYSGKNNKLFLKKQTR